MIQLRTALVTVATAVLACVSVPDGPPVFTTAREVKSCKPLGEVLGESMLCSSSRARRSAFNQAQALGATHIVEVNSRCVVFVGWKTSARLYDCEPTVALDEVYEDYLERDPGLHGATIPSTAPARVMRTSDPDGDARDLVLRGYALVGFAGAEGGTIPIDVIHERAKSGRAAVVLVHTKLVGQDVEYQAVTTYSRGDPQVATTTASGSATIRGHSTYGTWPPYGWTATGYGSSTAVTRISAPGLTQTSYVPFAQRRYDTQVLFWRERRAGPWGLFAQRIPAELRTALGRNTGAFVVAVEEDSPAFFANILAGDVVIRADSREILRPSDLADIASNVSESQVILELVRPSHGMVKVNLQLARPRSNPSGN